MSKTAIKIGPADHGRQMSLDDFKQAEEQEGYATIKPPAIYRPRLLPGFEFSIDDVFKSAGLN
jgi:hypothetical protein